MGKKVIDKRRKAFLPIAGFAGTNIVFAGAPKPSAEIPTHIALTAADFVMCAMIHEEYFGDRIANEEIIKTMTSAGILLIVAGGGGYAIAKGASGLIAEFTNFLGPLGWLASGLMAAGGTALLGVIWMAICDNAYRNNKSLADAAIALLS